MPLRPPFAPIDLGTRPLLLGPGGDVSLVDLAGGTVDRGSAAGIVPDGSAAIGSCVDAPAEVAATCAAGVSLVVVPLALAGDPEVAAAARHGLVVVVTGPFGPTVSVATDLHRTAGARSAVVVEVPVRAGEPLLSAGQVASVTAAGLHVGARFPRCPEHSSAADGWVVGALTVLLAAGVTTVRGVDAARFARVRNVHQAWVAAASGGATP